MPTLRERYNDYTGIPIWEVTQMFLAVFFGALLSGDFGVIFRISAVADQSFGKFYNMYGHFFAQNEERFAIPKLVASAHGTILELGACVGNQLPRMDKSKIGHVYGIEYNTMFVEKLNSKIEETDMRGKYTPVWAKFEDASPQLRDLGVKPGSVDCILSIQVLCSMENPREAVQQCWEWLRPGGELIFCEHGRSQDGPTRIAQRFWNTIWPTVMGGCSLTQPMEEILLSAKWEIVEMKFDERVTTLIPRISGVFRKPLSS